MKITLCPECKNYLADCDLYRFCMYCGWVYDRTKLIREGENEISEEPKIIGRVRDVPSEQKIS